MKFIILFALGVSVSSQQDRQKKMMLEKEIMKLEKKKSDNDDEIYDYQDANNIIQGNIDAIQKKINETMDKKIMADKLSKECLEDKKMVEDELEEAKIESEYTAMKEMELTNKAKIADQEKMLLELEVGELERRKMAVDEVNQMEKTALTNRQMELSTLKSQVENLMNQIEAARDGMQ